MALINRKPKKYTVDISIIICQYRDIWAGILAISPNPISNLEIDQYKCQVLDKVSHDYDNYKTPLRYSDVRYTHHYRMETGTKEELKSIERELIDKCESNGVRLIVKGSIE